MISFGEILLVLSLATLVLGPKQLQILLRYAGKFTLIYQQARLRLKRFFEETLQKQQLEDNIKKARAADEYYKAKPRRK